MVFVDKPRYLGNHKDHTVLIDAEKIQEGSVGLIAKKALKKTIVTF